MLILFWHQIAEHPLESLLIIILFEMLIFTLSFGRESWSRLEERAIQVTAELENRIRGHSPGFLRRYRKHILSEFGIFNVRGLGLITPFTLRLQQVFVDVRVVPSNPHLANINIVAQREHSGTQIWDFLRSASPELALVIIGPPGTGKTTLLQNLALTLAANEQRQYGVMPYIPIFLYARNHTTTLVQASPPNLGELVQNLFSGLNPPHDWFQIKLRRGKCLVLIDGLDEIADQAQRKKVSEWVDDQIKNYPHCRFVLTARPQGYRSTPLQRAAVLEIQPFNSTQVRTFLENWYLANEIVSSGYEKGAQVQERAKRDANDLMQRLAGSETLQVLAVNPLLLTMIAMVHRYRGALPSGQVELYAEICDVLLGSWGRAKGIKEELLRPAQKLILLRHLANHMMERHLRYISTEEAIKVIEGPFGRLGIRSNETVGFLLDIQAGSGLLIEREVGVWGFAHFTFQEYLTATYWLESRHSEQDWSKLVSNSWWHEPLRLYAALGDATSIIQACLEINTEVTLRLATEISEEAREVSPDIIRATIDRTTADLNSPDLRRFRYAAEVQLSRRLRSLRRIDENRQIDLEYLTSGEYQLFLDDLNEPTTPLVPEHWVGGRFETGQARYPVTGVRYQGAVALCRWITRRQGGYSNYRLPSREEERAYPARTGDFAEWVQERDRLILSKNEAANATNSEEISDGPKGLPSLPVDKIGVQDLSVEHTRDSVSFLAMEDNAFELAQALVSTLFLDGAVERRIVEDITRYFAQALIGVLNLLSVTEFSLDQSNKRVTRDSIQDRVRILAQSLSRDRNLGLDLKLNIDHELDLSQDRELALARAPARTLARALAGAIVRALFLAIQHGLVVDKDLVRKLSAAIDPIDRAIERNDMDNAKVLIAGLKNDSNLAVARLAFLMDDLLTAATASTIIRAHQAQRKYIARILSYVYSSTEKASQNYKVFGLSWFRQRKTAQGLKSRQQGVLVIYKWLLPYSEFDGSTPRWGAIRLVRETTWGALQS